ncbi:hypothetical protein [Streptomyces abyssomicinicus]|uniref:hypothetical protein n=1 Tax=Streptomyces abyssomicinicus TaxID=574929 RepID=UPI0012504F25|nr:hypothetical protein [Streptomyces abyssomicinicus]
MFTTMADHVHVSRTSGLPEASAHGWWMGRSGHAAKPGVRAVVAVWLQAKSTHGGWKQVAKGRKAVLSGGGSGKRATARKACRGAARTAWRSVIDVDVLGGADSSRKLTTAAQNLSCGAGI